MRYLVFAYDSQYPLGGWNDFVGGFWTLDQAEEALKNARRESGHIIDTANLQRVG